MCENAVKNLPITKYASPSKSKLIKNQRVYPEKKLFKKEDCCRTINFC